MDDFHTVFHLWEDSHKDCLLTDALEIHFIDVKKFNALPKKDIKNDSLHRWLTFFDQSISDDLLKGLIDMDAAIYKANEKMIFLANDKEVLRLYNMREMAQIDYNSGMKKARAERRVEISDRFSFSIILVSIVIPPTDTVSRACRRSGNRCCFSAPRFQPCNSYIGGS